MVARLAVVGLLAGLLGAAFPSVLFGDRSLSAAAWLPGVLPTGPVGSSRPPGPAPMRDLEGAAWVDEPAPYLVRRGLDLGGVLWNDAEGLGIPLLGNPNMGALSPLQVAVNLFPSARAQDLAWLARALALGVFTFGLARETGARRAGALAAATSLMLSGQTVLWIEHHPLNTDVFVPAALWAAFAVHRTGRRGVAWLALAVAGGLLGLKPQSAVIAGAFGAVWLAGAWLDRTGGDAAGRSSGPPSARWRDLAPVAAGVLLGAGLAAVALVPFAETYAQASGLVRAGRTTQSAWTLPTGALPSLGGSLAVDLSCRLTAAACPGADGGSPGLPYAGLTVVLGAAFGAWRTRRSWLSRALALTVTAEILRIHGLLPLPLGDVPIFGSVNYVKYCFPLYLASSLLLARAIDSLPPPGATLGLALVAGELLWLVPRDWAPRVEAYAPAPWVEELRRLEAERPGRLAGDVRLAPPLVSSALGLRDLRSIDVLTPRATYDFVSRLVAPSQGVTWILADPDPLLAATGPGADLADLRWIVSTVPLSASDLPAATRSSTTARRLVRLLADLERYRIETPGLGGGIHDGGGDRRFHWTCETPCRFALELRRLPAHFVAGLASPGDADLRVRLGTDGRPGALRHVPASPRWNDLWMEAEPAAGRAGVVVLEIESDEPRTVFVGGIGPAPERAEELRREERELAHRMEALGQVELRWHDDVAWIYENVGALGEAVLARTVVRIPTDDPDAPWDCVADHPGEAVACVAAGSSDTIAGSWPGGARVSTSRPDRLVVEVEARRAGLLLVSRGASPGWEATVDGRPVPIVPSAGALMAVEVPGGAHRVELVYAPGSLRTGFALTLLSSVIWVALVLSSRAPAIDAGEARDAPAGARDLSGGAG